MRIIFVRHGEPNYQKDCLTPHGHVQAKAVSERLVNENIKTIYASPLGRAQETAGYTAERLGLPIHTLNYMHEVTWGGDDIPMGAHPWLLSDEMIDHEDFDFYKSDWKEHPYFKTNAYMDCYNEISSSIDELLKELGFEHRGGRFFCTKENNDTIALFSHGGSGGTAIGHILGLPFPYVASILPFDLTSVTIVELPERKGEFVHPRLCLMNDMKHTAQAIDGPLIQKEVDQH